MAILMERIFVTTILGGGFIGREQETDKSLKGPDE